MTLPPRAPINRILRIPALTLTVGACLTGGVLVFLAVYLYVSEPYKNSLIFFAACCAAAGQLAAALYSARTLQLSVQLQDEAAARISRVETQELGRAAFRFVERWNDPGMLPMRMQWHAILETKGKPDELKKQIEDGPDAEMIKAHVKHVLNFLEEISLSVIQGYSDEDIAKHLFHGVVLMIWHCMGPWIKEQRVIHTRPQMWVNLENLYSRWN
jgi:Domain of unknown function (DUF4760)